MVKFFPQAGSADASAATNPTLVSDPPNRQLPTVKLSCHEGATEGYCVASLGAAVSSSQAATRNFLTSSAAAQSNRRA